MNSKSQHFYYICINCLHHIYVILAQSWIGLLYWKSKSAVQNQSTHSSNQQFVHFWALMNGALLVGAGRYWVIIGRYWLVLGGTGTVRGGTGFCFRVLGQYGVVLGHYGAVLVSTWCW